MSLKKLQYLSAHRGTKENDLILGKFACTQLVEYDEHKRALYADFLQEADPEIYEWIMEQFPFPSKYSEIIQDIQTFINQKGVVKN